MALLAAIGLMVVSVGLVSAEITCEPLAVRTGEPAYIICLFDVDVSVAKKNIKVQRRPLTSTRFDLDKTETVLDCYWQNAADFSCQFGNGFKLVGEAGRSAVVRIASASKIDEQVYMCEVVPSDPSNIQTCTLTLRDTHPLDGNFSIVNFAPEQLQDDTAQVKGTVTAIIIIICVIVVLVLVVLLIVFRNKLKQNLRKLWPRAQCHDASIRKKGNADQETASMLTESNKRAGDEGKPTENLEEKERIERYVKHLLTMKEGGSLDEFYKVSHTDEKEKTASDLIIGGTSALDRRHTYSEKMAVPSEDRAGRDTRANKRKERPESDELQVSRQYRLPNDPAGLHISVDEWYSREMEKRKRMKEEIILQKDLYLVQMKNRKEIQDEKKHNEKKKITDQNENPQQRKKREAAEKKRMETESDATLKLDNLRKKHKELQNLQEEQDRKRVQEMRPGLEEKNKSQTQSKEESRRKQLTFWESAQGEDEDGV